MSGVASIRWVRPIFTTSAKAAALTRSVSRSAATAGITARRSASVTATWIAVGKLSFVDWPRFTSSFGWTSLRSPRSPPRSSLARFASTSLTFMFVCVPLPVCQTTSGNSSSQRPASTSSAAATIATPLAASSWPSSTWTSAAAFLTSTSAWTSSRGMRSPEILKFRRERSVCAPHRRCASTSTAPQLSFSVRVLGSRRVGIGSIHASSGSRRPSEGPHQRG